jgi:hypothetical protein
MQRGNDSTPVKTQVKSDLSRERFNEGQALAHRDLPVNASRPIVSIQAWIGVFAVFLTQIGVPCAV